MKKKASINWALAITIVLAVVSLFLWVITPDTSQLDGLWVNLLAGFVASICTIAIIDKILKLQKQKEELPLQLSAYREIQLFAMNLITMWENAYYQSIIQPSDISINELFTVETFTKIQDSLDLETEVKVMYPVQTWFSYFEQERKRLVELGNSIINRYFNIIDPNTLHAIHYTLMDSGILERLNLIQIIHEIDKKNNIPRVTLFSAYCTEQDEQDFIQIKVIFHWCKNQYEKLKSYNNIQPIKEKLSNFLPSVPPHSAMSQEKLATQMETFMEWQKQPGKLF